ncbi:hypothetical protein KJ782_02640 [Patescibacteria group bacterium]|nr:hypothetical protein [Patescibacteria group bacterium]
MVRKMHPAQKIHSRSHGFNRYLISRRLERPTYKTKLSQTRERNEVICEDTRRVVVVPVIVEPVVVPVPPVIIPVEVTDVDIAISVAVLYSVPSMPLPFEYSWGCIVSGILNALTRYTK